MSRYVVDEVKGTVLDTTTGLTWQRDVPISDFMSFATAEDYADNLPLDGGGWRLPTCDELQSLVDDAVMPTIDHAAFPGCPSGIFWCAPPGVDGYCWLLDFRWPCPPMYGTVDSAFVRCVRGP